MAYRNAQEILYIRVPCTTEQKRKIHQAAESSDRKKYSFYLNALLTAADAEAKRHGTRNA